MANVSVTIVHPVKIDSTQHAVGAVLSVDSKLASRLVTAGYAVTGGGTASEVLTAHKTTAAQSVTNLATLTDLTGLSVTLLANQSYDVEALLVYDAPAANDGQIKWVLPAGATMVWTCDAPDVAATVALGTKDFSALTEASTKTIGGIAAGTKMVAAIRGRITMGGTAGVAKLQGAQAVAGAALSFVVHPGSFIKAARL